MKRMISAVRHVYGDRELQAGEEFDADDHHVTLLIGLGRATVATQTYNTRMLTASTQQTPALLQQPQRRGRGRPRKVH